MDLHRLLLGVIWCMLLDLPLVKLDKEIEVHNVGRFWPTGGENEKSSHHKVCRGTSQGINHQGKPLQRYKSLKTTYTNCTFVDGNLEIAFLDDTSIEYDLSFLQDIREITGYVLIMVVYADRVPLTSLRIIRGKTLFEHENSHYSLYVALNYLKNSNTIGLKELGFTSLHEILAGDVYLYHNKLLCFDNKINWSDILAGEGAKVYINAPTDGSSNSTHRCGDCHPSCEKYDMFNATQFCWGAGPDMCQNLSRVTCSEQCEGRCFGHLPNQCCHPECAGGCSGPTKSDCWACRNFHNDDECVPFCPPEYIYDDKEYQYVENPKSKLAYGSLCVDKCPPFLVQQYGACVKSCEPNMITKDGACEKCDGPCPKACKGTDNNDFLNSGNIKNFAGCTVIKGRLEILQPTIEGDVHRGIQGLTIDELQILSNVTEITGFLNVQAYHSNLTNLSFLRNLKKVIGRQLDPFQSSVTILGTSLTELGLVSLETINNGRIIIAQNEHLCYVANTNFARFRKMENQDSVVAENKNQTSCEMQGLVCHSECSGEGCWGPGSDQCISCRNFKFEKLCVPNCHEVERVYMDGNKTCARCDEECSHNCTGPGPDNCDSCRNVKDGPYCVAECPPMKYADEEGICQRCHEFCTEGCSGKLNMIGPGGCNSCAVVQTEDSFNVTACLNPDTLGCDTGYFYSQMTGASLPASILGKRACKRCHEECRTCKGPGPQFCEECKHYSMNGLCVPECFSNYFADINTSKCTMCDQQCIQCKGATARDCKKCRAYKVYLDDDDNSVQRSKRSLDNFVCVPECPEDYPYSMTEDTETICVTAAKANELNQRPKDVWKLIVGTVVSCVVLIVAGCIIAIVCCRQRARSQEATLKLTARISGLEESEPLTPSEARPDMSNLRLIKEDELRRGNIVGSGAFGTVYKGVWIPTGENVKIPVAIKVLSDGTSPSQNKELLEEARVMASVDHPCCVRILAVCMTAQMMLITSLMPLGCLLDYVRNNRNNIGSKVLLNWCTQIAKGMQYLESRGIVHRDLAARNVLVQSPGQVKITDFGLAKLLDYNEEEYVSGSGKMPIKWLALECIQHRVFTHKSDVWSFGVTVWELFTYGQRPYESVRARDVPDLLEKGERLPQPHMCTIDVYMIMIKCWMLDAESRPSFTELMTEFAKMARDPGRYLVITGDRLMRLPSHQFDTQDLIRSMSVNADGPEVVMDAEDYLQPHSENSSPQHVPNGSAYTLDEMQPSTSEPQEMQETTDDDSRLTSSTTGGAARYPDYTNEDRNERKYSGLEAAAAAKKQREKPRDSVSSRYSADPCKVLGPGGEWVDAPMGNLPSMAEENELPNGAFVNLPVDEDDYLQPRSTNPALYMDLIDGPNYAKPVSSDPSEETTPEGYMEMSPTIVQNPEYFDGPESMNSKLRHPKDPTSRLWSQSSDSGASDPDYYNEYDKLKLKKSKPPSKSLPTSPLNGNIVIVPAEPPRSESMV